MKPSISKLEFGFFPLASVILILSICGCGGKAGGSAAPAASKIEKPSELSDKPLAPFQADLFKLAFESASAIPLDPHIKDRSKAQEAIVEACLKLDQPARALGYIGQIADWRRGSCYASLAFYCAQHNLAGEAPRWLDLATSDTAKAEDWGRDVIRVKVARTHAFLGQTRQADTFEKDVAPSEQGKVAGVKAMVGADDSFDEQMKILDAMIAPGNFDITKNALAAYAQLFNRFYADEKRRALVEEKMKKSWDKMPIFIRIDLVNELTGFALDHADKPKAIELADESQAMLDGFEWPLENRIPMVAKAAVLRFRAGDVQKAHADADAARVLFDKQGKEIVNIFRAEALQPLAEAYQAMGDRAAALSVYKKAVEEGYINPNSKPRAEDLSATCGSMALSALEPDPELWARLREIREGLGKPW